MTPTHLSQTSKPPLARAASCLYSFSLTLVSFFFPFLMFPPIAYLSACSIFRQTTTTTFRFNTTAFESFSFFLLAVFAVLA
jgi:hypothetical protein